MPSFTAPRIKVSPEKQSYFFVVSGFLFRLGLVFETFEDVRPLGIQIADYFFFASLLLFLCVQKQRLWKSTGSGVLLSAALILCGGVLSLTSGSGLADAAGPLVRVFILFALFAPLAVAHSANIRENMLYLLGGIFANCLIVLLQAWVFPGIVDILTVNPTGSVTDWAEDVGRFAGLAGHPNILGLSAALGVLIGIGILLSERKGYVRGALILEVSVCSLAAILSGSRTFLVSVVSGLLALALVQRLNRKLIVHSLVTILIVWGCINYLAPELLSQYAGRLTATNATDTENYGRLLTAAAAVAEISQKPIAGWGVERFGQAGMTFLAEDKDFLGAHVSFLQYWYAVGVLGALGFLALFFVPVRRMWQALKRKPSGDSANALRLGLSVYASLFVGANLHPLLFNRFLFMPLFVFAGFAAHVLGPRKAKAKERAGRSLAPLPASKLQVTSL
jgi:O-antigen ligase